MIEYFLILPHQLLIKIFIKKILHLCESSLFNSFNY